MKTRIGLLTTAITIVAFGVSSCTSRNGEQTTPGHAPPGGQGSTQKAAETWTCPMHPQIKKSGPGQCPICGMNLVKAEETKPLPQGQVAADTTPSQHAAFHLPEHRQQMIGVKLGRVEKKPLFKTIEAAGRVAFDPELYTAQSEYIEAINQAERVKNSPLADVRHSAQRMVDSSKLRLKVLGLSDPQISALRDSGSVSSNLLLPGAGQATLVYAEVYEMDLADVRSGQSVKITSEALGGTELAGKVVSVDRVINPMTRTAKVRIQVPNARINLRPETFVNVAVLSPLGEQLVVPFDAVLDTGKEAWVFVAGPEGAFEPRKITIKQRAGDEIAIGQGLKEGDQIVTSGNFLIDSESRLKGVQQGTAEGGKPATPECPKGQFWHPEMKHCMPKTGG